MPYRLCIATVAFLGTIPVWAAGAPITSFLANPPIITGPTNPARTGIPVPIDVAGAISLDGENAPGNTTIFLRLGAGVVFNSIGWDVNLTAFGTSWRRDLSVRVSNSSGQGGFYLFPSADASPGGPTNYRSVDDQGNFTIFKLAHYNISDIVLLGDGLLMLHFFDLNDDAPGVADGLWGEGSRLFYQVIPSPAGVGLLALAGLPALRRKRR